MSKLITVHGATGKQGGSVARCLLAAGWKVRALTRNASGSAAHALAQLGADVVSADLDDESSLIKAYDGVDAIFLVTNFWEHLFKGMTPMEAGVAEAAQALTVVRIANKLPSLKHFIWSTLPGNVEGKPRRTVVHHFDGKANVDHMIRRDYPDLAVKTTYLYVGYYANNLVDFPMLRPFTTPGSFGTYLWIGPIPQDVVVPSAGDVTINVGIFARAILEKPYKTLQRYVAVLTDLISHEKLLQQWTMATGKDAKYLEVNSASWNSLYGEPGEELYLNLKAFQENPQWVFENDPICAQDLGIENEVIDTIEYFKSVKDKLV